MQELIRALVALLKVKSLMTLLAAGGLLWGFIAGNISGEQFMTIVAMVFTFYFARNKADE